MGDEQEAIMLPWIRAMIDAKFITGRGTKEDYLTHFCVDCCGNSLTESQAKSMHVGHNVLRSYICSRSYTYRLKDLLELKWKGLDVSGVAPFVINHGYVLFRKSTKRLEDYEDSFGKQGFCFTCGRKLERSGWFCSMLCKFKYCSSLDWKSYKRIRAVFALLEQQLEFECLNSEKKKKKKKVVKKRKLDATQTSDGNGVNNDDDDDGVNDDDDDDGDYGGIKKTELENLIADDVHDNEEKVRSMRKRPRKAINPCRAPFY